VLAGKRRIFLQIDQTRKAPSADTTDTDRVGAHSTEGIGAMLTSNQLRIYYGPKGDSTTTTVEEVPKRRETVTIPLMEVLPLLADAMQSQRTWLKDFDDDEATISMDLYEVLLAYQHYRRPSA
jgi:hypothetical protein